MVTSKFALPAQHCTTEDDSTTQLECFSRALRLCVPRLELLSHLSQRLIHDMVRQVHALLSKPLQQRSSGSNEALLFCVDQEAERSQMGNAQGGCASARRLIIHKRSTAGVCQRVSKHGTFAKAEIFHRHRRRNRP